MFECPGCGGNLVFDIASQKMHCPYCDTYYDPYEVKERRSATEHRMSNGVYADGAGNGAGAMNNSAGNGGTDYADVVASDEMKVTVFECPQCGATIYSADNSAAEFCSFCGASTILNTRISNEKRPTYAIPFAIDKEECKRSYLKRVKKAIYAPRELTDPEKIEEFRGIYMPYWSYEITNKDRAGVTGKKSHRSGDYIITDNYRVEFDIPNTAVTSVVYSVNGLNGILYDQANTSFMSTFGLNEGSRPLEGGESWCISLSKSRTNECYVVDINNCSSNTVIYVRMDLIEFSIPCDEASFVRKLGTNYCKTVVRGML